LWRSICRNDDLLPCACQGLSEATVFLLLPLAPLGSAMGPHDALLVREKVASADRPDVSGPRRFARHDVTTCRNVASISRRIKVAAFFSISSSPCACLLGVQSLFANHRPQEKRRTASPAVRATLQAVGPCLPPSPRFAPLLSDGLGFSPRPRAWYRRAAVPGAR
jgi:hypothetical protein